MRKSILIAYLLIFTIAAFAQEPQTATPGRTPGQNDTGKMIPTTIASPRAFVKTKNVDISYGQPSKKDRVIFGGLLPYGQVWRTGANEATEITLKKNAVVGGKSLPAGTYTLFTIPEEKKWTIILNSQLGQWGAFEYEKYKGKDLLNITIPVQTLDKVQEKLLYEMKKDSLVISWDKTAVAIPVTFKK